MSAHPESLHAFHRKKLMVPLLLVTSAASLVAGLWLPVITLEELIFWRHTFSVITGILSMLSEGHWFLALVIFLFSIVFPLAKLVALTFVWFRPMEKERREFYLGWLEKLGKWSMLDVFVVSVTIVIAKVSTFASAKPEIGIYIFGFSILLAMIATMKIEHITKQTEKNVSQTNPA